MDSKRLVAGVAGGLVGGLIFGVMMRMMGMLGMVAGLVGQDSAAVGWVVHLAISVVFGAWATRSRWARVRRRGVGRWASAPSTG